MRSVACGPMMWMPSVSSVSRLAMILAKPSYSPPMIALPTAWNGIFADLDRQAALLALLLGQADRGDLGAAVRGPRLLDVVHRVDVRVAGDRVGRDDPLVRGGVGEHQPADDVADRVQVRLLRPHVAVDLDDAAVDDSAVVVSSPTSSTFVARPAATSSISAAISVASLPSGPTVIRTPSSPAMTDAASNRALVMTLIPRRVKLRSSSLLTPRGPRAGRSPGGTPAASPSRPGRGTSRRTPRRRRRRR